jgi:mannose-6-phosphate isomerase-like protein (cupin superfamily)
MSTHSQDAAPQLRPQVGTELVNPVTGTRTVFRATAASTGGAHVEVEQTFPPHSAPPPLHLHPHQDEHFTVLSGLLHAVVGGVERDLGPGAELDVPRGTSHQMWGAADTPTVVVWRTAPALRTDQLYCDLWSAAAATGFRPDLLRAYQVTLTYEEEFQLC